MLLCDAFGDRLLRKNYMNTGVLTMLMLDRSVCVCLLHDALIDKNADELELVTLTFH